MAWLDCHCRSRESYVIRITTLDPQRWCTPVNLTEPFMPIGNPVHGETASAKAIDDLTGGDRIVNTRSRDMGSLL
jgi:hypothetical protein